ncbi:MAG: hypothetical protein Q8S32_12200 [Burkholderiaceae bacterium]|nr:hypothetical protein [Burkholderiaceae bacterium]MDP3424510.1 hypothetical protein [Burkholderiaceae bacterium]
MSEYSLTDFKEWLEENKFKMNANDFICTERTLNEFEKEQEKPKYYVYNDDIGRDNESWDVRRFDKKEDIGYLTIAVFFIEDIPDAEKRANDLCDELNEKELDKIMPNLPPRCGKYKLLIIDDPSRELKAKSIARDVAQKCGLRLPKDY